MRISPFIVTVSLLTCAATVVRGETIDLRTRNLYLRTLAGEATTLGPYAGHKLTLVNLWATYCGPCVEEMPALDALHKKYKKQGFAVIGVDVDEGVDQVKRFLDKHKLGYPILMSTPDKTVPTLGGLEGLPTTVLLDERGDVLEVLVGGIDAKDVEQAIKRRVGKPERSPSK